MSPFSELTRTQELPACCPNCLAPITMEQMGYGHYCPLLPLETPARAARPRVGALLALVLFAIFGLLACGDDAPLDPPAARPAACAPVGNYAVAVDDVAGPAQHVPPAGTWAAAIQPGTRLLELDGPGGAVIVVALDGAACGGVSVSSGSESDGSSWRTSITFGFDGQGFGAALEGWGTAGGAFSARLSGVRLQQ